MPEITPSGVITAGPHSPSDRDSMGGQLAQQRKQSYGIHWVKIVEINDFVDDDKAPTGLKHIPGEEIGVRVERDRVESHGLSESQRLSVVVTPHEQAVTVHSLSASLRRIGRFIAKSPDRAGSRRDPWSRHSGQFLVA